MYGLEGGDWVGGDRVRAGLFFFICICVKDMCFQMGFGCFGPAMFACFC